MKGSVIFGAQLRISQIESDERDLEEAGTEHFVSPQSCFMITTVHSSFSLYKTAYYSYIVSLSCLKNMTY